MSLISAISATFSRNISSPEEAFRVKDITSPRMREALSDWFNLYYAQDKISGEDPSQRMAYTVVSKLTKTVFSEYSAAYSGDDGQKSGFVSGVLAQLDAAKANAMQNMLIGGEALIKPVLWGHGFAFLTIRRDRYCVVARDVLGRASDLITTEETQQDGKYYTLAERRTVDVGGYLTIQNRLYRSDSAGMLGQPVPLTALDKYAALPPEITYAKPVWNLGLIPLRTPVVNCVDGGADGVSVYAAAAGLIHGINRNEQQINDEFENGASRIIVSEDLLKKDREGRRKLSDRLFIAMDDDTDHVGVTIFSPALREASYLARKNEYLRNVENVIGLKRGILSEVEAVERTATEITSSAGDYNLTIQDFQSVWSSAVREAVRTCDVLGQIYKLCDSAAVKFDKLAIDYGNGILYDEDKTWADYMDMVAAGMMRPEIALAWKFNIPWKKSKDLADIREKYMPELDAMLGGD